MWFICIQLPWVNSRKSTGFYFYRLSTFGNWKPYLFFFAKLFQLSQIWRKVFLVLFSLATYYLESHPKTRTYYNLNYSTKSSLYVQSCCSGRIECFTTFTRFSAPLINPFHLLSSLTKWWKTSEQHDSTTTVFQHWGSVQDDVQCLFPDTSLILHVSQRFALIWQTGGVSSIFFSLLQSLVTTFTSTISCHKKTCMIMSPQFSREIWFCQLGFRCLQIHEDSESPWTSWLPKDL